ncbi:stress protein [Pseudomonas jessenii]|uniref:Stress responsive A/B Barrel Domain n=1 Tax=Pseudomonas jessenii TaxID=77298 RepID=A0A231GSA4_PSEJE|nr:Dabb family protein [Pseudomonas jessenii]OXR39484.1 stress protein [Pseudomonas jessenii]SEC49001.1 Stress responsive A/B Barrel Domain [Pseudomonas jessenii]
MMRHIVMFRRLPDVPVQPQLEAELVERMRTLPNYIDFIRDWHVETNELERSICWDYLLDSSFDNAEAVERYLPHPAHQALVKDLKQYFEWAAVDYTA